MSGGAGELSHASPPPGILYAGWPSAEGPPRRPSRLAAAANERSLAAEKAARIAELEALDERETLMGLAGLMVVFAMMSGLGAVIERL